MARTPDNSRKPWIERGGLRYGVALIWSAYPPAMLAIMLGIMGTAAVSGVASIFVPALRGMGGAFILLWMMGAVGWIVVRDAKRRWPHLALLERWIAVVTFDGIHQDRVARQSAEHDAQGTSIP